MATPCEGVSDPACVERFWAKVGKPDESGCRNWTASTAGSNQPVFGGGPHTGTKQGRKLVFGYRFAYTLANGPIPEGMVVRHTCDNELCCEPSHLVLGSQGDNMRDMAERHVSAHGGQGSGTARLTHEQAAKVYDLSHRGDLKHREIAAMFGVSRSTVTAIKNGRKRAHTIRREAA